MQKKARGNRTYYDANGRPYKITANGREYVKQEIKGNPDDEGATPPKGQRNKKSSPDYRIGSIKDSREKELKWHIVTGKQIGRAHF